MKVRIILGAVALLSILFFLRPEEDAVPSEHAHFAMGTLVTFKLYTEEEKVDSLVRLAFDRIDRIRLAGAFGSASPDAMAGACSVQSVTF